MAQLRPRHVAFLLLALTVGALTPALSSCAQEVGLIDRTQAGLLSKAIFEGEWFMRRTVIDAPYDVGYTFIGEQDEAVRMRWEIQHDLLVAYRVHPFVAGTDQLAPVAAFAIKGHVDVMREYNAATGEQTNVLGENTTDRQWYDREFIRVDWSKNLVTNFYFTIDALQLQPVAYASEDKADPDRLLVGQQQADGSWRDFQDPASHKDLDHGEYLDVVTRVFVQPEEILVEDWDGTVYAQPACWYYLSSDCQPGVVTVRNSFLKVDAALSGDYAPLDFPDNAVARDAAGDPVRVRWNSQGDRERVAADATTGTHTGTPAASSGDSGPTDPYSSGGDSNYVRLPWFDKFGFFRTERYGYDPDYGEVESARIYQINRWNIWDKSHDADGNLLPYAERGTRKIVYYLSPDFPADMREGAQRAVDQWDEAFRATATNLTGADPGRIFELRDNTRAVDATTGAVLTRGEVNGDLRYSHIYWVSAPLRVGLLGYGPAAIDPLSGEILAADAYIYGSVVREVAVHGRDIVDLINGRLDPAEVATGSNVTAYIDALKDGSARREAPSPEAIAQFARDHRGAGPASSANTPRGKRPPQHSAAAGASQRRPGIERLKRPAGWARNRISLVRNTGIEELLLGNTEVQRHFGFGGPGPNGAAASMSAADRAWASPARWASTNHVRQQRERFRRFTKKNMYMASFMDDAVAGAALELKDTPSDQIIDILAQRIFRSTAEHEVGHTLGLRHNFEGSTDALNYHPEYWQLRGDTPAPLAAMTTTERDGRLREYQYSSIMDYAGRFNADTAGLGRYDGAAIAFGYGGLVEVFDATPSEPLIAAYDVGDGTWDRAFTLDEVLRQYRHYTKIPSLFGGVAALGQRHYVPWDEQTARLSGKPATDAYVAQLKGDAPWRYQEVPYRFCSDEYVDATDTCHVFDLGADVYEIVTDAIDRYQAYYWFNNFKRDRVFFDEWDYMDAMWGRYFSFIHTSFQNWVFNQWFAGDGWDWLRYDPEFWEVEDVPWTESIDAGGAATAAMMESVRFLNEVIAQPEPGAYWYDFDEGYYWSFSSDVLPICEEEWSYYSEDWCSDTNLQLGEGRWFNSIYDWESGYYFYDRLRWVGSFWDKLLALETMTNPDTFFLGVASSESFDEWAINMYVAFPKELQKIFSGIAADRFDLFAGVVEEDTFTYVKPNPFATGAEAQQYVDYGAVDPSTSFTIQLYALWYGMAFMNANYDNTFNDGAKIWVVGSGEALEPTDPGNTVEFASPFNQRRYATVIDPDPEAHSVGQIMIDRANQLLAEYDAIVADGSDDETIDYYKWRVTSFTENIEVVRGLYDLYGYLYF